MNILISEELLKPLANLKAFFDDHNSALIAFKDWEDLFAKLREFLPDIVILGPSIPPTTGFECSRQIKERLSLRERVVIVVSDAEKADIKTQLLLGEADICVPMEKAYKEITLGVKAYLSAPIVKEVPRRGAARFKFQGSVAYFLDGEEIYGEIVNMSRTGMLLAVQDQVPSGKKLTIRLRAENGEEFDLKGSVARSVPLTSAPFEYAIGVMFEFSDKEQLEKMNWILSYRSTFHVVLSFESIRGILSGKHDLLAFSLTEGKGDAYQVFVSNEAPFERKAFSSPSTIAEFVQRLVWMRVQFDSFFTFFPTFQARCETLAPDLLPTICQLIERAEDLEKETDKHIRNVMVGGSKEFGSGVNDSCNRLYESKLQVLFALDEGIDIGRLSSQEARTWMGFIKNRVEKFRIEQKSAVRYKVFALSMEDTVS